MTVEPGDTATLNAEFRDENGDLIDATLPKVSIIDADDVTVVSLATPTHDGVGLYSYDYAVAESAPVGTWQALWYGLVNGEQVGPVVEEFSVATGVDASVGPRSACSAWTDIAYAQLCGPCADVDPVVLQDRIYIASDLLFELSGHRFPGSCSDTVYPCGRSLGNDGPMRFGDVGPGWGWSGASSACSCNSARSCGCGPTSKVTLGGWPVTSITEVTLDGEVVDPLTYHVEDSRYLARNAPLSWPCCSDDFSVRFTYGVSPPPAGRLAAATLACELALACVGNGDGCRLPRGIRSMVRQGVSIEFVNLIEYLRDGFTGILEIDMFLAAYGPSRRKRLSAAVVNPDIGRAVRRITS